MDPSDALIMRHRKRPLIIALAVLFVMAGVSWFFLTQPRDPFAVKRSAEEQSQLIETGEALYLRLNCIECHGNAGEGIKGPSLAGIVGERVALEEGKSVLRDHRYLRRALSEPSADVVAGYAFVPMPSYADLEEEQVVALLLYVRSLKSPASPVDEP